MPGTATSISSGQVGFSWSYVYKKKVGIPNLKVKPFHLHALQTILTVGSADLKMLLILHLLEHRIVTRMLEIIILQ